MLHLQVETTPQVAVTTLSGITAHQILAVTMLSVEETAMTVLHPGTMTRCPCPAAMTQVGAQLMTATVLVDLPRGTTKVDALHQ